MIIPFQNIQKSHDAIYEELSSALNCVLKSGNYILGDILEEFENVYAKYCEAKFAVGVGNGYDALVLGLMALGVRPGDEVIVPAHTYIATWLAVSNLGAIPVPVDIKPDTFTINPNLIEESITKKTKVILPVHLYGQAADLDEITEIANKYRLLILEDAAQAHGSKYKGKKIGSHGNIVAWSFYPGKNLGALGDGGGITTDSLNYSEEIRMLRNYGSREKYVHEKNGINSRLDPMQAAVLKVKLKYLDSWNEKRVRYSQRYSSGLVNTGLELPKNNHGAGHAWHQYVVRSKHRDKFREQLANHGVETGIHYPRPIWEQAAYKSSGYLGSRYPESQKAAQEIISLPIYPTALDSEIDYVIDVIQKIS